MFFFDFQFCEYRILDFMELEHIILKQSLSINIIFYMKHTKVQYSHKLKHCGYTRRPRYSYAYRKKYDVMALLETMKDKHYEIDILGFISWHCARES